MVGEVLEEWQECSQSTSWSSRSPFSFMSSAARVTTGDPIPTQSADREVHTV